MKRHAAATWVKCFWGWRLEHTNAWMIGVFILFKKIGFVDRYDLMIFWSDRAVLSASQLRLDMQVHDLSPTILIMLEIRLASSKANTHWNQLRPLVR
jgi:hypothetical protein